jgi:hypothetical protein
VLKAAVPPINRRLDMSEDDAIDFELGLLIEVRFFMQVFFACKFVFYVVILD